MREVDQLRERDKRHRHDATEALCNAVVGMVVSWAATWFVLGYSAAGSLAVTGMFFCLSFIRSFVLRAIFRRFHD